ncbi:MAG: protein ndvB [Rhizobiaceae bacterium]|nr:protein ndvB [Rhizobiaceae bacterium]
MNVHARTDATASPSAPLLPVAEVAIRANFLDEERLRKLGESLAAGELGDYFGLTETNYLARNKENAQKILDVYLSTNAAQARGESITPAAQWLLDNNYLVEETIFQIKRDLPPRFLRELPRMDIGNGQHVPRTLAIAWLYVAHVDSTVSSNSFKAIVDGFQSRQPLQIGELWALPSLLRYVLIENLRRLAQRVGRARNMRHQANDLADKLLALDDEGDVELLRNYTAHARDITFATQLLYRLRDGSQNAGRALMWLEGELEAAGTDAEQTIMSEHRQLSSGNVTTGNIIRGLRLINDVDWTVWFEGVSRIDALLREKTNFELLDFQSRDQYRAVIEELARRARKSEYEVASKAIELAGQAANAALAEGQEDTPAARRSDVGFFLVGSRRRELEQAIGFRVPFYLRFRRAFQRAGWIGIFLPVMAITMLLLGMTTAALLAAGLPTATIVVLLLLFALPAGEGAMSIFNTVVLLFLKPTRLIGYEYKGGVPDDARTLVVVPTLIGSRDDVDEAIRTIEVHHLSNMHGDLFFALLSDWPDSQVEIRPIDKEILEYAQGEIAKLNARYESDAPRFHLLHRRRLYNKAEGCWMGWERKRGKLHELNQLLRGDSDTTFLPTANPVPTGVVHVMTLDADTKLTRDTVARLVGKMMHPLNKPMIDEVRGKVKAGHAIMQPRITASLTTGDNASFFQRVFSAHRGLDPYVFAVSDLYQDVFEEGTFTGKGLYHVDAMEAALHGKIPENAILSHDLLEGSLARAALVTDIEVVEDYPTRYAVDASRQHRWARGDWQLLPFIFDSKLGIPAMSRWKMIDNLRRSLTPIFWVLASIAGWSLLPFTLAAQWQALLILSQFMAPTFDIVNSIIPKTGEMTFRGHVSALARDALYGTAMVVLKTVLMAHTAWMMGDAIVRTFYRLHFSHQHLLEWRPASQAQRNGGNTLKFYYSLMYGAVAIAVAGLLIPLVAHSTGAVVAAFFAVFWAGSPAFAWLISRSAETEDRLILEPDDRRRLRNIARRTWHYYETHVTAEHSFLPPDNMQEVPVPVVANRTSPTNVGVYLLSVVSARDFGWISMRDAVERMEATLGTLERMERHRGHLYNWYDTKTLLPLHPLYISSVDSGNLAGHLITMAGACGEWAEAPSVYLQGDFEGMLDVVDVLEESLRVVPDDRRTLRPLRQRLSDRIEGMRRAVQTVRSEPEMASIRTINLAVLAGEIRKLADGIHHEAGTVQSEQLADWSAMLERTAEAHVDDSHGDKERVDDLRKRLDAIRHRARAFALEMDFSFLLSRDRKLLSIGYRVEEHQLDESCYDLLASECRMTSLYAIAKGDIPTDHWFKLGRPIVEIGFSGALMSWSGSMFEYLMPPLVMKEPNGGLLNQTSHLIIKRQIQYGDSKGIPWGISEAAYNARDHEMTYQYTNFGVPGLGLKRGLAQNTVIAPYATILASQFMPREAVQNLERLASIGGLGRYGYYDAIDFTPQRVPEGADCAVVYNYYAHHQGMSIAAISNIVFEGRLRDRFHSDPIIEAAELLLQERAPRDIPIATVRTEADERVKVDVVEHTPDTRLVIEPLSAMRATGIMSNGSYQVMVAATGSGYSRWNDLAVTRWQPDPTENRMGTFIFLRDVATGDWWSATAEPKTAPEEKANVLFSDDKATFSKLVGTLRSEVECIVVSEGNGEARRVTLFNEGDSDRHIELTSYAELALAYEANDNAHPAFSKMFVKTEIAENGGVIYAERRKRSAGEPDVALAHFVTETSGGSRETEAETDRRAFLGRGRTIADAAAFDGPGRFAGNQGFVLDPVMALRCRVRVPANKKVVVTFWTVVGKDKAEVEGYYAQLNHPDSFQRQMTLSWTRSQVQTRHCGLSLSDAANVQKIAGYLLYPDRNLRMPPETIAQGMGSQSALWPMAISGDFPIFALRIADIADIEIVAQALRYQEYMRARGLLADLVIVNEQASSYVQDLQQAIENLCENSRLRGHEFGPRQHIFAVRRDLMDQHSYRTLLAVARIVLHTRNGTIFDQIERAEAAIIQERETQAVEVVKVTNNDAVNLPIARQPRRATGQAAPADGSDLTYWNGIGGFDKHGSEYVVRLTGGRHTPQPWINVMANENFGFHTSSEGASFTWSRNSRDFQLTPWSNDPVSNRPGEGIYVVNRETGTALSPFAALLRDPSVTYEARHGQGYSIFTASRGGLTVEATQIVDSADPVKITRLRLVNSGRSTLRLRVYSYAEWVMGNNRARSGPAIVPSLDAATGAVLAANPYSLDFGDRVAFLGSDRDTHSFTADRAEFFGRERSVLAPGAVLNCRDLSGKAEAGVDPCAAMAHDIEVPTGGEASILLLLGDAGSISEASRLVAHHRARDFGERLGEIEKNWRSFLDTLQVHTPDLAFNAMVNNWLPYQSLSCRIRARSAFYQSSGAFGFRDQLQDTLALMLQDPSLARGQILNAAHRQFAEGDVQHWWLPRTGAGVRTIISDDVAWLGYAVSHYIATTGDVDILKEQIPFIEGQELQSGQHDAFFTPEISKTKVSLYEHCARAIDLAVKRTGEGGLPLILGGDWNDGMNNVGAQGRGESVWLGWFLLKVLTEFASIAREQGDGKHADAWKKHAGRLKRALENVAWDGEWYRRGSFDDGTPLGSRGSAECRIDSIAQSWSVLSGDGDETRSRTAMEAVMRELVDDDLNIIKLFTPPFSDATQLDPGYIKAYPPGVRENGGQYTHAATWVVCALAELGQADAAYRCFSMLNPVNHALDAESAERYRVEPYVVAADVYSEDDKGGRGGWTWYTGSAGWLYRAAVEYILGIRRAGDRLTIDPVIPGDWKGFSATLHIAGAKFRISVERKKGVKGRKILVGGKDAGTSVPIAEGKSVEVVVQIPA